MIHTAVYWLESGKFWASSMITTSQTGTPYRASGGHNQSKSNLQSEESQPVSGFQVTLFPFLFTSNGEAKVS